jgi:hypothetical protein
MTSATETTNGATRVNEERVKVIGGKAFAYVKKNCSNMSDKIQRWDLTVRSI